MRSPPSYDGADVVVVNTCGFLDSAKAESLEAIGEAIAENGKVIVTGCFGVEDKRIRHAFPNMLAVTGPHQYDAVMDAVHARRAGAAQAVSRPRAGLRASALRRKHYAYLKIAEGCNNKCSFCIIPQLRGMLVEPARRRCHAGGRGAGRDRYARAAGHLPGYFSAYGIDMKFADSDWHGSRSAPASSISARRSGSLGAWVRLHYVYPYPHVDEVMPLMAEGRILPYLDIPFQHAAPDGAEGHAPPREPGQVLARMTAGARSAPTSPCAPPSSSAFPARPRTTSSSCSTGSGSQDRPRRLLQI